MQSALASLDRDRLPEFRVEPKNNMQTIFRDGKIVVLAMDHAAYMPVTGLTYPGEIIKQMHPHLDAFLVNFGVANTFREELSDKAVLLRADTENVHHGRPTESFPVLCYDASDAVAVGAHALVAMCYTGHPGEPEMRRNVAKLVSSASSAGLPVMVESLPLGLGRTEHYTPENVSYAARLVAELGANIAKIPYTGDINSFRQVVENSFIPIVVLGGSKEDDDLGFLKSIADAMTAGAAGVAIGRNIWGHAEPAKMAACVSSIVHENATAQDAYDQHMVN